MIFRTPRAAGSASERLLGALRGLGEAKSHLKSVPERAGRARERVRERKQVVWGVDGNFEPPRAREEPGGGEFENRRKKVKRRTWGPIPQNNRATDSS